MRNRLSGSKRYPYWWKRARLAYLAKHASCVNIGQPGCTGTATCIDHIVDHKGDGALFHDRRNWQAMCHHCHSVKTAKAQLRVPLAKRYDVSGMPLDEDHHWRVE